MSFNRRRFVQGIAGVSLVGAIPARAQSNAPIRLGLMTVKTGPLASGGIDMERALTQYLKEHQYTMGGRKVELFVGDSGGVPAQCRRRSASVEIGHSTPCQFGGVSCRQEGLCQPR